MGFRDLLPLVREKCQGMLDRQALDHLKKAYRKFCIESGFVIREQKHTINDDLNVSIEADEGHYVLEVLSVDDAQGRELTKGTHYKVINNNSELVFVEGYDTAEVTFSIAPRLPLSNSLSLEQSILDRWPDELAAGAAATLRKMPDQEWTDFNLSQHYEREFIDGYREAYRERVSNVDSRQLTQESKRVFF